MAIGVIKSWMSRLSQVILTLVLQLSFSHCITVFYAFITSRFTFYIDLVDIISFMFGYGKWDEANYW